MRHPIHANNRRWHGDSNYDLEGRDAAIVALRSQGLSQEAIAELHSITQGQVSRRLKSAPPDTEIFGCHLSVSCRSCGAVFSAARTTARYCGSACRVRAFRAEKGA